VGQKVKRKGVFLWFKGENSETTKHGEGTGGPDLVLFGVEYLGSYEKGEGKT